MPLQLAPDLELLLREASEEARRRDQASVTMEHLFLGMVRHRETGRGLRALGLDLLTLADQLERFLSEHVPRRRFWHDPTPRQHEGLLRVMQRSILHALSAQQETLRTGDVLAALLREKNDSHAADLLRERGLRRVDLLRYLEHGLSPGEPILQHGKAPRQSGDQQVILHNDHYTTMEFVSDVLSQVFCLSREEAEQIMLRVHQQGKGVAGTYLGDIAAIKAGDVIELAELAGFPLLCTLKPASP